MASTDGQGRTLVTADSNPAFYTIETTLPNDSSYIVPSLNGRQGDSGREIPVRLTNNNLPMDLTGYTVYIMGKDSSGAIKIVSNNTITSPSTGRVTVTMPAAMYQAAGEYTEFWLEIREGDQVISSVNLNVQVWKNDIILTAGASADYIDLVTQTIATINAKVKTLTDSLALIESQANTMQGQVSSALADLAGVNPVTPAQMSSAISAAVNGLVTTTQLQSSISGLATTAAMTTAISKAVAGIKTGASQADLDAAIASAKYVPYDSGWKTSGITLLNGAKWKTDSNTADTGSYRVIQFGDTYFITCNGGVTNVTLGKPCISMPAGIAWPSVTFDSSWIQGVAGGANVARWGTYAGDTATFGVVSTNVSSPSTTTEYWFNFWWFAKDGWKP